jgi:methylated-DNA-protein-cysteine methyltransferase-like protein
MTPFTKQVVDTIRGIPEGYVMTYGQIAAYAGSPRGARQVVRILHSLGAKYDLPWHRVVNAKGEIAFEEGESRYMQQHYLEKEGVVFDSNGRIDLEKARYVPS